MSTRAMFTFIDADGQHHVYKQSDGYPEGAAQALTAALAFAWQLPRFEADEFAAAFIAANKSHWHNAELALLRKYRNIFEIGTLWGAEDEKELASVRDYAKRHGGGDVRTMASGSPYAVAPCDIEWRYEVRAKGKVLEVTAYQTNFWDVCSAKTEKRAFKGSLAKLASVS